MPIVEPGALQVERLPDGKRRLLRELNYEVDGIRIAVPTGFITDYSSVPFGLLPWHKVDVAGVVHDWLYGKDQVDFGRLRADWIWFKICRSGDKRARLGFFPAFVAMLVLMLVAWIHKEGWFTGPKFTVMVVINISVFSPIALGVLFAVVRLWRCICPDLVCCC